MADITEEGLKVFIQNDFEQFNAQLEKWYGKVMAQERVVVAIARKAPRLLGYCALKFPHLYKPDVIAISDIAVPFIKWDGVNGHCLVIDEAIYHGTTFGKVLKMLKDKAKGVDAEVKGLPWVVTQDALGSPDVTDALTDGWDMIGNDNCNFFIDTVISKFFELGKPYDIEYPLFYATLPADRYDKAEIDNIIDDVLEKLAEDESGAFNTLPVRFKNTNYRREDQQTFSAFTYCTDYVYQDVQYGTKPDFSKLRIFHDDKAICIASMAPYTIDVKNLAAGRTPFHGKMSHAWRLIMSALQDTGGADPMIGHQEQKSLAVMLNYLLSVNHFLRFKERLARFLSERMECDVNLSLREEDLQWLVGRDLASALSETLMSVDKYEEMDDSFRCYAAINSLIPMMYQDDYSLQLTIDNMYDKSTVSSVISNVFSDLHWIVEVKSRSLPRDAYDRLAFGESLSSIQEMCANLVPGNSVKSVHANIDQRIDRGSMVPDYVYVSGVFNNCWKRMFRSGENEDLMRDQHFRICINVLKQYLRKICSTSISAEEFQLLFALLVEADEIFNEPGCGGYSSMFATKMKVFYENGKYRIFAIQGEEECEEKSDLQQRLCDYHIIIEKEVGEYEMSSSSYTNLLSNGFPLSEKQTQRVNGIMDFVAYAHKRCGESTVSELRNYACFSEDALGDAYSAWKNNVISFLLGHSEVHFDNLASAFVDLYISVPEPRIDFGDNLFASSRVGTWMKRRCEHLKNSDFALHLIDKLHAAFYMLNLWNKVNGGVPSCYYDSSMYDGFYTLVSLYLRSNNNGDPLAPVLSQCGPDMNVRKLLGDKAGFQDALCRLLGVI